MSEQHEQPAQDAITLRPGDYVLTSELRNEAHYREVAAAFDRAGCPRWEGAYPHAWRECKYLAWFDCALFAMGGLEPNGRHLTPAQVIAAAPAKEPESERTDPATATHALDRYRTAQRQAEERAAWDRYVAAAINDGDYPAKSARVADQLLELRRERFPG